MHHSPTCTVNAHPTCQWGFACACMCVFLLSEQRTQSRTEINHKLCGCSGGAHVLTCPVSVHQISLDFSLCGWKLGERKFRVLDRASAQWLHLFAVFFIWFFFSKVSYWSGCIYVSWRVSSRVFRCMSFKCSILWIFCVMTELCLLLFPEFVSKKQIHV